MGKQIFQSLRGMSTTMSKLMLVYVFVYGGILKRFAEASGIPFFITEKGLNLTTEAFAKRAAADMDLGPYSVGPFHHDSNGLKANVEQCKFYDVVLPEGIHIGILPEEGLKVGANNISFAVDCEWRNASLYDDKIGNGKFSAKMAGVNVRVTVDTINSNEKPLLNISNCEASIDYLRPESGDSIIFIGLIQKRVTKDLQGAICRKAMDHVRDQITKLEKQISNSPIFTAFTLSKFAYSSGYIHGILKGYSWKGGDDEYPEVEVPTNFMVGGVFTEKSLNLALKVMYKRHLRDFSLDVDFMDELAHKFGLHMPLANKPIMNVYMPSAPKARITSRGINITSVGRVIVVPCRSAINRTKWLNSTLTLSLDPQISLAKNRRSLIVKLRHFRVTSGLFQSGPESDLVDEVVAFILKNLEGGGTQLDLLLPEGTSIAKTWMTYNDGNATLFMDLSKDEQ